MLKPPTLGIEPFKIISSLNDKDFQQPDKRRFVGKPPYEYRED
ncbi:MAG: hypothetical protein U0L17_04680 [Acutalibacteraceae bacterium]|nr:hypothetical protein [Acutalibacteraceae bacterium]